MIACTSILGAAHAQSTTQSLFTNQIPVLASASDGVAYELGMKFQLTRSGQITALRYWKSTGDSGTHVGRVWSSTGALLASTTFVNETASGWQQQALPAALLVQANTVYVVSVNIQSRYPFSGNGLASQIVNGYIASIADGKNGVYAASGVFPTGSYQTSNYFRDIVFVPDSFGAATRLILSPASANAQTGAPVALQATVQDANGNTVLTAANPITFSANGVTGSFSSTTVTPSNGVAATSFNAISSGTATITASATGLTSASSSLAVATPSGVQQSLFSTQTPAMPSASDGVPYELGTKLKFSRSGQITGVRYWKAAGDPTTHVGRIWSATGTLLAATTFTNETTSGWQQQALPTPLSVAANVTYVVSVNIANTYSDTLGALATVISNGDISSVADGNNGVFGPAFAFPSNSFQNSNYFRDVVFVADNFGAPAKIALTPATTTAQTGTAVAYVATVQDASGNTVTNATNSITFSTDGMTGAFNPAAPVAPATGVARATFTPTSPGTATITASSAGLAGGTGSLAVSRPAAVPESLFTTQVPALPDVSDLSPYELGMKFQVAHSGEITAIRYWKSPSDTGRHVGRVWSATGVLLASTPFSAETASGWQQQALEVPLAVLANTTYVVSVNMQNTYPYTISGLATAVVNGNLRSVADGNNGVYATPGAFPTTSYQNGNYFRDVVFVADTFGAAAKLALTPATASTQAGIPVTYTATIQDAIGNTVSTATNTIALSVSGVTGAFYPASPLAPTGGIVNSIFIPSSSGTAIISASADGLAGATASVAVAAGSNFPVVISQLPAPNATGIAVSTPISAAFNESVLQNSVNFTLTGPANAAVAANFSYNDATRTVTLQPTSPLAPSTTYTARVASATDANGQTLAAPISWSFTTGSGELGQWSPVYNWPCVSIHTHLLPDGKVLSWADDDTATRNAGFTKTYVVDVPVDGPPGASIYIPNTTTNLFCSGHTFLPDGRLITTGGHNGTDQYGATDVVIFEDRNGQYAWYLQPNQLNAPRWYPSTASLSNGEAVVLAGSEITGVDNPLPQVWQTNQGGGLRDLTSALRTLPWYPRSHLAPNGKLFVAAPEPATSYLDTSGTGAWTDVANRLFGWRDYGSSVMYDTGKLIMIGGSDPPTATAEIIDLTAATPAWQWTGFMQFARRQMNATVLPDGKVLATGGTSSPGFSDATNAVLPAEMWDPATGTWSTMASMQVPRLYHSTAILLPDGRVLSAGGGRPASYSGGVDHWNAEIYSPPYLFKGPRPVIASVPSGLSYGQAFTLQTADAASITDVTLVRLSSVTHGFNMNQRFGRLSFTRSSGVLNITAPSDRNTTPPGHYMLFILNSAGVPSIAKIIQIL
jgi:hypothetical protein